MRTYVFSPPDESWKVYYLTNAVGTNDRIFINEIKSEKAGVMTPGLLAEGQAIDLPHDYVETTVTALNTKAVALGYTLKTYEDKEVGNKIKRMYVAGVSVTTVINDVAGTINVSVPNGTTITALAMTFQLSDGASVKIGNTTQVSGTTTNNFESSKTYVVTPASGATKSYVVSVTVLPA